MPKSAKDLRLHGITFEDAIRRVIATPPPPTSKKSKKQKAARIQAAKN
jgi:hypothetical protein